MAETIYINSEDKSNKFWSYEIDGKTVHVKWGRVGTPGDSQDQVFGSSAEVQRFVSKKVKEKEKKGYKLVTKEKLKEETQTAQELGAQNKIKNMQFVSRKGNDLVKLDKYDPKQYVYVEVLNSWSKAMTRLVLTKDETYILDEGVTESGSTISTNGLRKVNGSHPFAEAVRRLLKKMSETIVEVLKSVKFAAMGNRNLFDDEAPQESNAVQDALAKIETASFDAGVITKFAAMGVRSLDL